MAKNPQWLGHADLNTTLSSYTHSLDLILNENLLKGYIYTPHLDVVASWAGISKENIRVIRSRYKQKWNSKLLEMALENNSPPKLNIQFNDEIVMALPERFHNKDCLTFIQMAKIHHSYGKSLALEKIAEIHGQSLSLISSFISITHDVVVDTEYKNINWPALNRISKACTGYIDNNFFKSLSFKFDHLYEVDHFLCKKATEIWRVAYRNSISGLKLISNADQEVWNAWLIKLGARKITYAARHMDAIHSHSGIVSRHKNFPSRARENRNIVLAPVILGQFHDENASRLSISNRQHSQKELHYLMLLLLVKLQLE